MCVCGGGVISFCQSAKDSGECGMCTAPARAPSSGALVLLVSYGCGSGGISAQRIEYTRGRNRRTPAAAASQNYFHSRELRSLILFYVALRGYKSSQFKF